MTKLCLLFAGQFIMIAMAWAQPQGVSTYAPYGKSATTAEGGGYIVSDGGFPISALGSCWSTAANPTVALTTKTTYATGVAGFTSQLTGLVPGTTYHVRSYATYAGGTVYGPDLSFVINPPTVTETPISNIIATGAQAGGNVTADGSSAVSVRGVCWSTLVNPTVTLPTKTMDSIGTGIFTSNITGLTAETIYHVRAYATNATGTSYGPDLVFIATNRPTLTTNTTLITSATTATSGGNVIAQGNSAVTARGVCWGTALNPTTALTTKTIDSAGMGNYTSTITGLVFGTIYHVRSYATNSAGTSYGNDNVFTTVGERLNGGIIAYVYLPGETGYVAGETHGLVVAPTDQGIFTWNYANPLCNDLVLNNFSDWRLPNKNELSKIYANRVAVGLSGSYWSSEHPVGQEDFAFYILSTGSFNSKGCTNFSITVRAIRSF